MAIPKLNNVPIKMYSVGFLSCDSFKSPNRNTDLAANKKPIPSQLPVTTKIKTKRRSKKIFHKKGIIQHIP